MWHLFDEDGSSLRPGHPLLTHLPTLPLFSRSNTLTNYSSAPTTTVTHDHLYDQIIQLEEKLEALQLQHLKNKERLFLSTLLSIKVTLSQKGEPLNVNTPASEIFDELLKTEIPEVFWPQWIQHRLLVEHEGLQPILRDRSETVSTNASVESNETLRKVFKFFDSFRSSS